MNVLLAYIMNKCDYRGQKRMLDLLELNPDLWKSIKCSNCRTISNSVFLYLWVTTLSQGSPRTTGEHRYLHYNFMVGITTWGYWLLSRILTWIWFLDPQVVCTNTDTQKESRCHVWWCMSLTPTLGRQVGGFLWVSDQASLHSKFRLATAA